MLQVGGTPGNPGNPNALGRPASVIREQCRGSFAQRIPIMEAIADSGDFDAGDRIRAIDTLGKYGLDVRTQMGTDEVREKLRATVDVIRGELGPQVANRLLARIRPLWSAE